MWKWLEKNKTSKNTDAEPAHPAAPVVAYSSGFAPGPDSVKIKAGVEEEIKKIENLIDAEREAYRGKAARLEEEKVRLNAHLELIDGDLSKNLALQNEAIMSMRRSWSAEIKRIETRLAAEEKIWEQKLREVEEDIDRIKISSRVEDDAARSTEDSASLALRAEIRALESRLAELLARRQGESATFGAEVKKREEEIAAIKAQIALRANHLKLEEDKFAREKSDLEEKCRARIKSLEEKFAELRACGEKSHTTKQEELLAFETAVKQRRLRYEQEAAARKSALDDMKANLSRRIKEVEAEMAAEKGKYEQLIKEREDTLGKIKVELMLGDTASEADREKRLGELSALKDRAEKQIKELEKRYDREKSEWEKRLTDADRAIEDMKIQTQIKMREMSAGLEKSRAEIDNEKKALSMRFIELEREMLERKIAYEKIISEKNAEIEHLTVAMAAARARKEDECRRQIEDLALRKSEMEGRLRLLESARAEAAGHYEERLERKNAELALARAAVEKENERTSHSYEEEKTKILAALKPLEDKIVAAQEKRRMLEEEHALRLAAVEERIVAAQKTAAEKTRDIEQKYERASGEILSEISRLEKALAETNQRKESINSEMENLEAKLAEEKRSFEQAAVEIKSEKTRDLERLSRETAASRKKLLSDIAFAEKEMETLSAAHASELKTVSERIDDESARLETKTAALKDKLEKEKAVLEARKNQVERDLISRREDLQKIQKATAAEMEALRSRLDIARRTADETALAAKDEYRRKNAEAAAEIESLKTRAADLSRKLSARKRETAAALAAATSRMESLAVAIEDADRRNDAETARLREEYERENRLLADEIAKLEKEAEAMKSEHAASVARLREELEKTEEIRTQKITEKESSLERIEAEHRRSKEKLETQIKDLAGELAELDKKHPEVIAEKERHIADISAKIREAGEKHAQAKDSYSKAHDQFIRRNENRKDTLRAQIESLKEKHSQETAALETKISAVERECVAKENALKNEWEQKEKQHKSELARIEKIKEDLEKNLRDQTTRGRDGIRELDKKIYELQTQLSYREKSQEEELKVIQGQQENEKKLLTDEIIMLRNTLADVQNESTAALQSKNDEMVSLSSRRASELERLGAEIRDKESQWKEASERLSARVAELRDTIERQRGEWENLKTGKEKELADLNSRISTWEYDIAREREKIRKEHEFEKARLEKEIAAMSASVDKVRRESEVSLVAKQNEIKAAEERYNRQAETAEAAWRETENRLLAEREKLQNEISAREAEQKEREAVSARAIAALEKDIEDKKLKMALAVSEFESERIKTERENKNVIKKLERESVALVEKYNMYNETALSDLSSAEDKISELTKRLLLREERLRSELAKKHDDAQKYIDGLREEFEDVVRKAAASSSSDENRIIALKEELGKLSEDVETTAQSLSAASPGGRSAEEFLHGIRELEKSFSTEREKFAALLEGKMAEINELEGALEQVSKEILAESARRRDMMDNLRKSGARFAYKLRYLSSQSPAASDSAADDTPKNND